MARFDLEALFAIDSERKRQSLSWATLSREVGVAASTIRRFAEADDAEADGVLAVVRWLGVAPGTFVAGASNEGEALAPEADGFVRVDMDSVRSTVAGAGIASNRTRMAIQQLVAVAGESSVPVASLTRVSEW